MEVPQRPARAESTRAAGLAPGKALKKLPLPALLAATYFMVAGGPYGLEDLLRQCGYQTALLVIVLTPLLWSLPNALMVGELASALPAEGGYYVWVKRALGPFWGFQEAWLSLCASVFDMAIYPTLFLLYLGRLCPGCANGATGMAIGAGVIAACALANLRGARAVGGSSQWMGVLLLVPFVVFCALAFAGGARPAPAPSAPTTDGTDLVGGLVVAMWNFMGWDNASTIAGEVERPRRNYPLAVAGVLVLVLVTYLLPIAAAGRTGLPSADWVTGAWVDAGRGLGGPVLATALALAGMICGLGMMDALAMSYSRLPMVMAADGYLPMLFARRLPGTGAPWAAILALSAAWVAALGLGFERLVELDVILYGLGLMLEFAALLVLRLREPGLERPFRIPGGAAVVAVLGLGPAILLGLALVHEWRGHEARVSAIVVGAVLLVAGPVWYGLVRRNRQDSASVA